MTVTFSGKVWVFGDNLNTDAMYPAFAMKMDPPEAAKHIFYQVRPGWTDQVSPGDIVVAGKNFGLGSSRPVASLFTELGVAGRDLVGPAGSHLVEDVLGRLGRVHLHGEGRIHGVGVEVVAEHPHLAAKGDRHVATFPGPVTFLGSVM